MSTKNKSSETHKGPYRFQGLKGNKRLINKLISLGFEGFGPSIGSQNGYFLKFPNRKEIVILDNRIYRDERIHVTIFDNFEVPKYKTGMFGLVFQSGTEFSRSLYSRYFENCSQITNTYIQIIMELPYLLPLTGEYLQTYTK